MSPANSYLTVKTSASTELVINKSRFIGQCIPISSEEEGLEQLAQIRKRYWDATHNCYAYSVGRTGEIARFSDDGEPGGTAGMPMMDVLQSIGLTNVICVVTRYFGGILLGTGGLVRAYSRCCSETIHKAGVLRMALCDLSEYLVPYHQWPMFQKEAKRLGVQLSPEYGEKVRCIVITESEMTNKFKDAVFDLSAGSLTGNILDHEFCPVEEHEKK